MEASSTNYSFFPEKVRERGSEEAAFRRQFNYRGRRHPRRGIVLRAEGVKKCLLRKLGLCLALGRFLSIGSHESLLHSFNQKEICDFLASNMPT